MKNKNTTLTSLRLKNSIHEGFKNTCETNNLSISKTIETLIMLFLSDFPLQCRVLREAHIRK
jgi:hypothetical protein